MLVLMATPSFMSWMDEEPLQQDTRTMPLMASERTSVVAVVIVVEAVIAGTGLPSWASLIVTSPAAGAVNVAVAVTL